MKTQRITISMPDYLYQKVKTEVPQGEISSFIVKTIEENLYDAPSFGESAAEDFLEAGKGIKKRPVSLIVKAIRKGRF